MTRDGLKYQMQLAMSEHHSGNSAEAQRIVDAILAAIEAAGVRLVPVEGPDTHSMVEAGLDACSPLNHGSMLVELDDFYAALLAASPYAPQKDETK